MPGPKPGKSAIADRGRPRQRARRRAEDRGPAHRRRDRRPRRQDRPVGRLRAADPGRRVRPGGRRGRADRPLLVQRLQVRGDHEVPGNLTVLTDLARSKEAKAALERAEVVADAVHQVRDWVNTPAVRPAPGRVRRARAEARQGARRQGRGAGREGPGQGRVRRHPRRRPGVHQPAAADPAHLHPEEAGDAPGLRRQGHHLRLRRPVAEDRQRDDQHEGRHGRRRRGGRRHRSRSRGSACRSR